MGKLRFIETTRQRYETHVEEYQRINVHGGRVDVKQVTTEPYFQVKVYHNPYLSTIGKPEWKAAWTLVAMALIDRKDPTAHQYFILKEVEMGVNTTQIGLNGEEE